MSICKTLYLDGLFLIFLPLSCFILYWMAEAVKGLIVKLDAQFLEQVVMDAMGIVYPQYWLQVDVNVTFL
jgi:hypothetical protein